MLVSIEQILYTDPQGEKAAGKCPVCGGNVYLPGLYCVRCGEEKL